MGFTIWLGAKNKRISKMSEDGDLPVGSGEVDDVRGRFKDR